MQNLNEIYMEDIFFPIVSPMQKENRSSLFLKESQSNHGKNLFCKEETSIKTKPLPFYTFQSILVIFKSTFSIQK